MFKANKNSKPNPFERKKKIDERVSDFERSNQSTD